MTTSMRRPFRTTRMLAKRATREPRSVLNGLLMLVVIRPLKRLSQMADQVSTGNLDVPDVTVTGTDEVAVLSGSFNRMRISLTKALKMLESE